MMGNTDRCRVHLPAWDGVLWRTVSVGWPASRHTGQPKAALAFAGHMYPVSSPSADFRLPACQSLLNIKVNISVTGCATRHLDLYVICGERERRVVHPIYRPTHIIERG